MEENSEGEGRQRDRKRTEARIVKAAMALVAREGFQALGVNNVAREAGVDKVLIYRYFGDLSGLVEHLGKELDFWLGEAKSTSPGNPGTYGEFAEGVLLSYLRALRRHAVLQRLLAWELVSSDEVIQRLSATRSRAVSAWFRELSLSAPPPPAGVDVGAVNALLIGAVHHLVLRESSAGEFAGVSLQGEESWVRIEQGIREIIARIYP